jgi:hypothetical protein
MGRLDIRFAVRRLTVRRLILVIRFAVRGFAVRRLTVRRLLWVIRVAMRRFAVRRLILVGRLLRQFPGWHPPGRRLPQRLPQRRLPRRRATLERLPEVILFLKSRNPSLLIGKYLLSSRLIDVMRSPRRATVGRSTARRPTARRSTAWRPTMRTKVGDDL